MVDIPHGDVNDRVVAAADQIDRANFRDGFDLPQETTNHGSFVFGQLDKAERLQLQANGAQIHFRMGAAQDSRIKKILDAFVARGGGQSDGGGDLLVRQPSILLQEADYFEVCSVKSPLWHIGFEFYSIVGIGDN